MLKKTKKKVASLNIFEVVDWRVIRMIWVSGQIIISLLLPPVLDKNDRTHNAAQKSNCGK